LIRSAASLIAASQIRRSARFSKVPYGFRLAGDARSGHGRGYFGADLKLEVNHLIRQLDAPELSRRTDPKQNC